MFDDDDARGDAGRTCDGFGDAFAGRGASHQPRDRRASGRCCATSCRSRSNLSDPDTQPQALHRTSSATPPRDRRAGRRGRRPSCSSTSTRRSPRCARSRARTSRTRSPRAARRSTRRSARSRSSGRSCATPRACSASCARACARCAPSAPDLADALEIGTPTLRRSRRAQPPPRAAAARAADVRRGPAAAARRRRAWPTSCARCDPTLQHLAPAQLQCNYMTLWFRNVSSLLSRGRRPRHLAALHHHRHAAGPQQRGRPVLGARQRRRTRRQPPALQPVPEHRLAGPAQGVRGRQRAVTRGGKRDRQRARHAAGRDRRRATP